MAQDGERRDPYAGFNFRMEIDGIEVAGFKEISGLEMDTQVIEYAEGEDENSWIKLIPGRTKFGECTFKRGIAEGNDLWEWCETINDYPREIERKSITMNLLDNDGEPQKTYTLFEAWPKKYSTGTLDAGADDLAMEEITFVFENLEIED
jgi:phage tail-like protein